MSVVFQDLINQTNDYISNYVTSQIDLGNRTRAINRATEFFQRRMGLPSDQRVYSFYFVQPTNYYTMPVDFNEPIDLIYHDYNNNFPGNEFFFQKYPQVLRLGGINPATKYFSYVPYNGSQQLLILGNNLDSGSVLDSFDNAITEGWVGSGDANTLAEDNNIFTQGSGSLSFNITPSSGTATLTFATFPQTTFTDWFQQQAWVMLDIWFTTTNFTSVQLKLQSSTGNYYNISVTNNADGTAWTANQWNTVAFKLSNAAIVGSPKNSAINYVQINFVEGLTFTAQTSMRVDNMTLVIPDYVDLIYYSNYKCTNGNTGALQKDFINTNDVALFGNYAPDLIGPIAKRAALELMPQLRQDKDWYQEYKQEVAEAIKIWGKTYPRQRIVNFGRTMIRRNQESQVTPDFHVQ